MKFSIQGKFLRQPGTKSLRSHNNDNTRCYAVKKTSFYNLCCSLHILRKTCAGPASPRQESQPKWENCPHTCYGEFRWTVVTIWLCWNGQSWIKCCKYKKGGTKMIIDCYHCPLLFAKKVSRRVSLGARLEAKLANRSAENPGLEVLKVWLCLCVPNNESEGCLFVGQIEKSFFLLKL